MAETLNLSELPGYEVGGTIHLVVNNQLGFTTPPELGRSSVYPTDVAKTVQAPIFHVNGDDPEACIRVVELAFDFRQKFKKDVVVDLVCYRRHGHNETDEPAFTQPRMYARIAATRSVRKLYTETLVNRGDIPVEEAEQILSDFRRRLDAAFGETDESRPRLATSGRFAEKRGREIPATAVPKETLAKIVDVMTRAPEGFAVHPKLERQLAARAKEFADGHVDWATAEALAFGSLVLEGVPVRLAGQDTGRGTFSQRHAVLVDQKSEDEYVPLQRLAPDQAPFMIFDSLLSEYAAMGFDYGYSLGDPGALVCWEAQFGDFVNGAQIVVDQYIAAAEDKWSQRSSLCLLLPHGFEGQGPEHSSGRIERFLHPLRGGQPARRLPDDRRAVLPRAPPPDREPGARAADLLHPEEVPARAADALVRRPSSRAVAFQPVLDDPNPPATKRRVLLCSGKIAPRDHGRARRPQGPGGRHPPRGALPLPRRRAHRGPRELPAERGAALGPGRAPEHGPLELRARRDHRQPAPPGLGRRPRPQREPGDGQRVGARRGAASAPGPHAGGPRVAAESGVGSRLILESPAGEF